MKITSVSTAVVEANFDWTYVRVETDEGLAGHGECFFAPGLTSAIRQLGAVVIGEDPRNLEPLWLRMRRALSGAGSLGGYGYNAITGIEAALCDLAAKAAEIPLYQLLGGAFQRDIRLYADCHAGRGLEALDAVMMSRSVPWSADPVPGTRSFYWDLGVRTDDYSPDAYALRAAALVERGFDALKFDVDIPGVGADATTWRLRADDVRRVVDAMKAVRAAVGPRVDLALDCHWHFQYADALLLAEAVEDLGLLWLEDPIAPPTWPIQLADLRHSSRTPICYGENVVLREGFLPYLMANAVDIISPDFQKVGGVLEGKRVADLAGLYGVRVAPHMIGSAFACVTSAHICAALSNFLALEFHGADVPFWKDIVIVEPSDATFDGGHIRLSDRPGVGFELDVDIIRRYSRPGEPVFNE